MTALLHITLSVIMGRFMVASVVMVVMALRGEQQSSGAGFVIAIGACCWAVFAWMMM